MSLTPSLSPLKVINVVLEQERKAGVRDAKNFVIFPKQQNIDCILVESLHSEVRREPGPS
jgi:hypothetical protein